MRKRNAEQLIRRELLPGLEGLDDLSLAISYDAGRFRVGSGDPRELAGLRDAFHDVALPFRARFDSYELLGPTH